MSSAAPNPRIPVEKHGKIIGLREMGLTYREIAARVGCSVGAVCELVKKHQQTGTVADRPIPGRKRVTTSREDRVMTHISLADRRKTAPQICACLQEHYNTTVSVSTVQ